MHEARRRHPMSEATHGGKGSKQRPVDKEKFSDNYDKIFGRKKLSTEKLNPESKSSKKGDSN